MLWVCDSSQSPNKGLIYEFIEAHGGRIITSTFVNDAAKVWNNAPDSIKGCVTIQSVKKQIKQYTATLPI